MLKGGCSPSPPGRAAACLFPCAARAARPGIQGPAAPRQGGGGTRPERKAEARLFPAGRAAYAGSRRGTSIIICMEEIMFIGMILLGLLTFVCMVGLTCLCDRL